MKVIMIQGTSSDAGKSFLVTGLCRLLADRGVRVCPFKSQNMSNNSMVCSDGTEIGRAQYLQATAAGVVPEARMNPVLLKPGTDRRSFIVLMGSPAGELDAGEYATGRRRLAEAAFDAYADLAARHELVLCEGAGSPAEINLRSGDYVNMGLARRFTLSTVIIGDIDRGGVLACLYGTWALLEEADRALLRGYVINKFRGDASILDPGLDEIDRRTGMRDYGVLPWLPDVWIDGEDSLRVDRWARDEDPGRSALHVAVVRLPRISNATDVEALAASADDNGGVYFVPAFSGLFAPHWRGDARGAIVGMTRYNTKAHIARAALEATAFQTREVLDAMEADSGVKLEQLRVDGGMTANDLLMQFQADILDTEVVLPVVAETTALGAAYAAGIAVGFWSGEEDVVANWAEAKRWKPEMEPAERERQLRQWKKAISKTLDWVDDDVR